MSRPRKAPATEECLLCGGTVLPIWHEDLGEWLALELCGTCNGAFHAAAQTVVARTIFPAPAPLDTVQVAGQLELDQLEDVISSLRADRAGGYQ